MRRCQSSIARSYFAPYGEAAQLSAVAHERDPPHRNPRFNSRSCPVCGSQQLHYILFAACLYYAPTPSFMSIICHAPVSAACVLVKAIGVLPAQVWRQCLRPCIPRFESQVTEDSRSALVTKSVIIDYYTHIHEPLKCITSSTLLQNQPIFGTLSCKPCYCPTLSENLGCFPIIC